MIEPALVSIRTTGCFEIDFLRVPVGTAMRRHPFPWIRLSSAAVEASRLQPMTATSRTQLPRTRGEQCEEFDEFDSIFVLACVHGHHGVPSLGTPAYAACVSDAQCQLCGRACPDSPANQESLEPGMQVFWPNSAKSSAVRDESIHSNFRRTRDKIMASAVGPSVAGEHFAAECRQVGLPQLIPGG